MMIIVEAVTKILASINSTGNLQSLRINLILCICMSFLEL